MPRVGFEPTIPALERAKTVHALDRAANVIGPEYYLNAQVKDKLGHVEHVEEQSLSRKTGTKETTWKTWS
jgi:hypothetical protein